MTSQDDLTVIKGIDREREEDLRKWVDGGVPTYQSVADLDWQDLAEVMDEFLVNVNQELVVSWPEQAALAAGGKWLELAKMKVTLPEWDSGPWADLTVIKGINFDMEGYLRYSSYERLGGIPTFESLARVDPSDIAEVLNEETVNPNWELIKSWPTQGLLAAAGFQQQLEEYQAGLPDWVDGPFDPQ